MSVIPVIVGLGGINAAGRSSGFHSYKRIVADALSSEAMASTWQDLAWRMKLDPSQVDEIKAGTLIRRLTNFDPDAVPQYYSAKSDSADPITFITSEAKLPEQIPSTWELKKLDSGKIQVTVMTTEVLLPITKKIEVSSGASLPTGFDPSDVYPSRNHPRAIKLSVYAASDALNSLGISWSTLMGAIRPDQVSVYAGGTLTQSDDDSLTGLVANYQTGKRFHSKMMALSFSEMPADFINSYVINSVGTTGTSIGACATFLYNLRQGMLDIKSGQAKVVIVGTAEAPIQPEIMEGFTQMGALAKDEKICQLDGSETIDNRRACRPFSENAGFTIAESSQFVVLMDDTLALELGMNVLGSVADVFIAADANKKSIAAPGVGNYITMAKAAKLAQSLTGDLNRTYVQAHGTGTPQNKTTESHIINEVAKMFSLNDWSVCAIKSYVGHSIGSAGGDQLAMTLGVWSEGWLPGIHSIDHISDDVHHSNLDILLKHKAVGEKGEQMRAAILNSKGFGGNNASAVICSPDQTRDMLKEKHGAAAMAAHQSKNEAVLSHSQEVDAATSAGNENIIYQFGESVLSEGCISMNENEVQLKGFANSVLL